MPTEAEIKEYSGSEWVARASQTPMGQAIMKGMFGDDAADSSTASDRASVRSEPRSSSSSQYEDTDTGADVPDTTSGDFNKTSGRKGTAKEGSSKKGSSSQKKHSGSSSSSSSEDSEAESDSFDG